METGAIASLAYPGAPQRIAAAAQEFEALVVKELLAPLFNSAETPSLTGGGSAEKTFASLLQDEYAKAIAKRGGFGVADSVKAALIDMQARAAAIPGDIR
ncbi:MAG: rod-binding protein [Amphiplicatus sp.]